MPDVSWDYPGHSRYHAEQYHAKLLKAVASDAGDVEAAVFVIMGHPATGKSLVGMQSVTPAMLRSMLT